MTTVPQKSKGISFLALLVFLISFLLFIILFFHFMDKRHSDSTSTILNTLAKKPAPQINLPLFYNENYLSTKQLKGRVTLINFWGSWCQPCREEHLILMKIAEDQRFDLIGINFKDNKENAHRFLINFGNPFKLIGFDHSGRTAINWGVYGPPETFLLDKNSIIITKYVGPLTWQTYQKKILPQIEKAIMAEETPSRILLCNNIKNSNGKIFCKENP
ncbi:DsbE family thiol:disulfide interchange protein [Bartonella sp. CB189]|uniref:DsbE family thiol:disulfide interchange protein n=1 Tax=Bartonella sp. CB189 TaxID=3112254 RepID=UPI002F96246D